MKPGLSSLLGLPDLGIPYRKNLGFIRIFGKLVLDKIMKSILSPKRSDLKHLFDVKPGLSSLLGLPDLGTPLPYKKNLGFIRIFGKSALDKVMKAILSQKRSDLNKKASF